MVVSYADCGNWKSVYASPLDEVIPSAYRMSILEGSYSILDISTTCRNSNLCNFNITIHLVLLIAHHCCHQICSNMSLDEVERKIVQRCHCMVMNSSKSFGQITLITEQT